MHRKEQMPQPTGVEVHYRLKKMSPRPWERRQKEALRAMLKAAGALHSDGTSATIRAEVGNGCELLLDFDLDDDELELAIVPTKERRAELKRAFEGLKMHH
jgi:hypothetical protein